MKDVYTVFEADTLTVGIASTSPSVKGISAHVSSAVMIAVPIPIRVLFIIIFICTSLAFA